MIISSFQCVLVILKIFDIINFSWWEVFLPAFLVFGFVLLVSFVVLINESGPPNTNNRW
jgi:hypothetical protein